MKIVLFLLTILSVQTVFSEELKDFSVKIENCFNETFDYRKVSVLPTKPYRMECSHVDKLLICDIFNGKTEKIEAKAFFEKKSSNSYKKFGSKINEENILIKDREFFYYRQEELSEGISFDKCHGILYTKEDIDNLRVYDLNFGLKKIVNYLQTGVENE